MIYEINNRKSFFEELLNRPYERCTTGAILVLFNFQYFFSISFHINIKANKSGNKSWEIESTKKKPGKRIII